MHPHEQSNKAISGYLFHVTWSLVFQRLIFYFVIFPVLLLTYCIYQERILFLIKLIIINKLSIYFVFYFYFFPIFLVILRISVLALLRVFFHVLFVSSLRKITFPHSNSTGIKDPDENWAKPVMASLLNIVHFFPFIPRIPIPVFNIPGSNIFQSTVYLLFSKQKTFIFCLVIVHLYWLQFMVSLLF